MPSANFSSCAITSSLPRNNYRWSGPLERALYFSTDFVMFSFIMSYKYPVLIDLVDISVITYPFIIKTKLRMSWLIRWRHSIYMIELQNDRFKWYGGGGALGSIWFFWGGGSSFGRALLPNCLREDWVCKRFQSFQSGLAGNIYSAMLS